MNDMTPMLKTETEVGAGKERGGVPVRAYAQPDEIGRPGQILQARIGRIPGEPIVRNVGGDRDHARPRRQEGLRDTTDVAALVVHRNEPLVGGDDRDLLPGQLLGGQRLVDRPGRASARKRDQRRSARVESAFDDEGDIAGDRIRHLVRAVIFPPFGFNHASANSVKARI